MNFHALFHYVWTIYLNTAAYLPFTAHFINFFNINQIPFLSRMFVLQVIHPI